MFAEVWPLVKTLDFLSLTFWFSIGLFRVVTFLGWFDTALDFWLPGDYDTELNLYIIIYNNNFFWKIIPKNIEGHSDALNYLGIATGCSVVAGLIPEYGSREICKTYHFFSIVLKCFPYSIRLSGFIINFWGNRSESKGLGQSPGRRIAIFYLSILIAVLGQGSAQAWKFSRWLKSVTPPAGGAPGSRLRRPLF